MNRRTFNLKSLGAILVGLASGKIASSDETHSFTTTRLDGSKIKVIQRHINLDNASPKIILEHGDCPIPLQLKGNHEFQQMVDHTLEKLFKVTNKKEVYAYTLSYKNYANVVVGESEMTIV